jgi:hypothetical protein
MLEKAFCGIFQIIFCRISGDPFLTRSRSPLVWSFNQSEVFTRKPNTIEKVVKIMENMAESIDEDSSICCFKYLKMCGNLYLMFSNSCDILQGLLLKGEDSEAL